MNLARPAKVSLALALLGAALSLGTVSCSRQDAVAARNAEIDRRIDERLAAKQQAAEQERLAQERADLLARERELEARENTFATMVARLSAQQQQPPTLENEAGEADGSSNLADESYAAPETYSTYPSYATYPDTSGQYYSEPYGYVPSAGPYSYDPYYCPPTTFVSIINQNAVIVNPRRNFHRRDGGQHHRNNGPNNNIPTPPAPPTELRPPVVSRPPMIAQQPFVPRAPAMNQRPPTLSRPVPTTGQRPNRTVAAPQVANRRVPTKPNLQRTP